MTRRRVVVAGVVLLAAVVAGLVLLRGDDDDPAAQLTVVWGGSEGHPSCAYDPEDNSVDARVTLEGTVPGDDEVSVTVTVTAYADENTSQPVGAGSVTVQVEGTVQMPLVVTIPVTGEPHVDADAETPCTHSVAY